MITWSVQSQLARSPRPGHFSIPVTPAEVEAWIQEAREKSIRSIICLLSTGELHDYYMYVGIDLLQRYQQAGFQVAHFPVSECFTSKEAVELLPKMGAFYQQAAKPCLVHCSAGVERTGAVIKYLLRTGVHAPST